MESGRYVVVFLILTFVSKFNSQSIIQIYPKTHRSIAADPSSGDSIYCGSWRFSVETNDAGKWSGIPKRCIDYVKEYMTGDGFRSDSEIVADKSVEFAKTVNVAGDGKDAWVFDIDETLLSNVPYYAAHGYGCLISYFPSEVLSWRMGEVIDEIMWCTMLLKQTKGRSSKDDRLAQICEIVSQLTEGPHSVGNSEEEFDEKSFNDWVGLAEAPALPASLRLYRELEEMGITIFLLTGREEFQRNVTEKNLLYAGYTHWEKLFLRGPSGKGKLATTYKSEKRKELEDEGYIIHGCSGDQWSDLLGFSVGKRSFKLPNPMYYIP